MGPVVSSYLQLREQPTPLAPPTRLRRISSTVVLLGLTSLFTDLASEMVTAVLPLYLTFQLGFSALQFGIVDGIYQGATALVRVAGGFHADTWQRHKRVATFGYAVGRGHEAGARGRHRLGLDHQRAARRPAREGRSHLAARRDDLALVASRHARRVVRCAPRPRHRRCAARPARGVHRAHAAPRPVRRRVRRVASASRWWAWRSLRCSYGSRRSSRPTRRRTACGARRVPLLHEPQFRRLTITAAALSLLTISEPFVYLVIQDAAGISCAWFPLLFVGTAVSYLVLAVPAGRLADRIGRTRVFVGSFAPAGVGLRRAGILQPVSLRRAGGAGADGRVSRPAPTGC